MHQIDTTMSTDLRTEKHSELKKTLEYCLNNSNYYKKIWTEKGIVLDDIHSIADLQKLPFTTKSDLSTNNDDFLCVPKQKVSDFVTTSGTTSDPVTFYLTSKDLDRLGKNEAFALSVAGGTDEDIYQLTTTIDKRFMAGLAYFLGIREMGSGIVRVGPGAPYLQWESILRFEPTVLIAIPSFIPKLVDYAIQNQIDYKSSSIQSVICIGEPIRNEDFSLNALGQRITDIWDLQLHSTYASTEMGAAFTECEFGNGGHLNPNLLITEVIGENDLPVGHGELGEVVISTLGVEGMPVIRYRTGDLCHLYTNKCNCGRETLRLGPVVGRKNQMIKFKGTTVLPPAIFDVLEMNERVDLYQVVISKNEYNNDEITVVLNDILDSSAFKSKLSSLFKSKLRVTPNFDFIPVDELQKRIFREDKRKPEKLIYNTKY